MIIYDLQKRGRICRIIGKVIGLNFNLIIWASSISIVWCSVVSGFAETNSFSMACNSSGRMNTRRRIWKRPREFKNFNKNPFYHIVDIALRWSRGVSNAEREEVGLCGKHEIVRIQQQVFWFGKYQIEVFECLGQNKWVHSENNMKLEGKN